VDSARGLLVIRAYLLVASSYNRNTSFFTVTYFLLQQPTTSHGLVNLMYIAKPLSTVLKSAIKNYRKI